MDQALKAMFFDRLMDVTEDCFIFVDREGRIIYFNENYFNTMPFSRHMRRDEIIGMRIDEVFSNSILMNFLEEAKPKQINLDMFPSGPEFSLEYDERVVDARTCANLLDENGALVGAFAHVRTHTQIQNLCESLIDGARAFQIYRDEIYNISNELAGYDEIVGKSEVILRTKMRMTKAAASDFSVMILGETGTGKELFAHAIHKNSARKDGPFIKLNCSAIPAELFESELFGYDEGAFTGAKKGGKPGKFELANGGSLFLDEIGDMPMNMQAKLLRVLQEREFERLGGTATLQTDVRIISATNKDIWKCIREKTFRSDLYYRLNVLVIEIPPLRERREDIARIAESMLQDLNEKYGTNAYFSAGALIELEIYNWPGNVRELRNRVERMYAYRKGIVIQEMSAHAETDPLINDETQEEDFSDMNLTERVDQFEYSLILNCLKKNRYNVRKTAMQLGLNRSTLYNKIRKYNLPVQED